MKIAIIGAGPAGLAAAYVLAGNDGEVTLLEKEGFVGGISRTIEKNGYRFDLGGHRFFSKNSEINAFLNNLIGEELVDVSRQSRIYFKNKYFDYPLQPRNAVFGLGFIAASQILYSYIWQRLKKVFSQREIITLQDWVVDKFGQKMFELYFKSYSEKVWGISCDRIAAEWVAQRIKGMSLTAAIKSAVMPRPKDAPLTLLRQFQYPRLGIGRICERMAESVNKNNRVILNSPIVSVNVEKNQIKSLVSKTVLGQTQIYTAEEFVSSMPITELLTSMNPAAPKDIIGAASQLRYRDVIIVTLMLDKEKVTDDTWLYIHEPKIKFGRIHEPKNWSTDMSPVGKTSLVIEYFCFEGDSIWNKTDAELAQDAIRDLVEKLGFIKEKDVNGYCVVRVKKAYPMYELGYKKYLNKILDFLSGFKNLQLVGRNGTFRYNNMDHSIEMGMKAAKRILGHSEDVLAVNDSNEYLEEIRS